MRYSGGVDLSSPHAAVLSPAEGPILAVLAGTTKALSGREVARLSGVSVNGAWKALQRLAEHGLVKEEPAGGKTTLYTLNREHLAAEAILTLTRLRSILVSRIKEELASWEIQPAQASLFGSAARGDGDTASDVDIFIVRPKGVDEEDAQWRSQLNELADAVRSWTGNHAGISEIPERELARLRRERPRVVQDVERDGITVFGEPASTLLRKRR
jgi:predicted nucleotidyltransferase